MLTIHVISFLKKLEKRKKNRKSTHSYVCTGIELREKLQREIFFVVIHCFHNKT